MNEEVTVVLGGAGRVGSLIGSILKKSGYRSRLVDLATSEADEGVIKLDVLNPSGYANSIFRDATTIVFALPESVSLRAIPWVLANVSRRVRLVSTCSVQEPFFNACRALSMDHEYVGLNPLFSPTLDPRGRTVAVCVENLSADLTYIEHCLTQSGLRIKRMTPQNHDQIMAIFQALPHAMIISFGLALRKSNLDLASLAELMPPPMRTMLALVSRTQANSPEVFWEIQRGNPYANDARARLTQALERLVTQINANDYLAFRNEFDEIARAIESIAGHASKDANRIFGLFREELS